MSLPILDTAGDAEERAHQQGLALRPLLRDVTSALCALPFAPRWIPDPVLRAMVPGAIGLLGCAWLGWHRGHLASVGGGGHLRSIRAAAAAAGVSAARLYGMNAVEVESSAFGFTMGCTSIALDAARTTSGHARLGYNHDFPPALGRFLRLRRSRPTDAFASVALAYAPLLGAVAGVNEHGLALTLNHAFATDVRRRAPGLFLTLLLQECLDRCRDVDEAARRIRDARVPSGGILTLVDAAGRAAAIERSATRAVERRPSPTRALASFNKYRAAVMEAVEIPLGARATGVFDGYDVHACNVSRARRFDDLVRRRGTDARWSDDDLTAVLGDHDGGHGDSLTICRHRDPLSETLASAVFLPETRAVRVRRGNACGGGVDEIAVLSGERPALYASSVP